MDMGVISMRMRVLASLAIGLLLWSGQPRAESSPPGQAGFEAGRVAHFGILAFRPKSETLKRWQPLVDYLNRNRLKQRLVLDVYGYKELEQAIREKRVDIVLTQPAHYILMAKREGLYSPLATLVERDGDLELSEFGGVIVTLAGRTDIRSLADLRGKRIATSSMESLGGYLMQAYELNKLGIDVPVDDQVIQTGMPHDKAVEAVLAGKADIGFVRTGVLEGMARSGRADLKKLAIIRAADTQAYPLLLSTQIYPQWALSAMPWVDEELGRQVAAAVLSLPHGGDVTKAAGIEGFTIPGNYKGVEDLMRALHAPPFDKPPSLTMKEIWEQHYREIAALLLLISLVPLALLVALYRIHRQFKGEHSRLLASEERFRSYVNHAPEGIFVVDSSGRFLDVNPAASAMVGYSRAELLTMGVADLSPPPPARNHFALLNEVCDEGSKEAEIILRRKNGSELTADLRALALPNSSVIGFCLDITSRKEAEDRIRHLAFFDPLTGLANRRLLMERLGQAVISSKRTGEHGALMMLDLDHFKDLNDTQGHDIGDRLLNEVARRLVVNLRQDDTIARLGGDEFVVVTEHLGSDESAAVLQAEHIAEKLHGALCQPYRLAEGRAVEYSTPSIGVTLFHGPDLAMDTLLKQADVALYQAKGAGRNTIRFFEPAMQAAIDSRAQMEAALRRGIREREFQLYYQPQVDWKNRVIGAEALLRWPRADGSFVAPTTFIPLAEDTGLIQPLGTWVLEQACLQLQRWQTDPNTRALTLAINVSGRQFHQPDFVDQVMAMVDHFAIDPARLKIELTESVVLSRIDEVIERMSQLRKFGVKFALDDFGTGYSSLSYLKRLPLNQVKLDQSFVRDINHDPNDVAIVRAIVAMSQSLELEVIAEGVETEDQRSALEHFGCKYYQGYFFGRPAPIDDFPLSALGEAA